MQKKSRMKLRTRLHWLKRLGLTLSTSYITYITSSNMCFICCTCQLKKSYSFSLWFCLSKIGTLQLYPIIECTRILDEAMEMLILDVFAGNVTSSSVTSRDILWHTVSYLLKQHCKFLCAMHCKYIACKKGNFSMSFISRVF